MLVPASGFSNPSFAHQVVFQPKHPQGNTASLRGKLLRTRLYLTDRHRILTTNETAAEMIESAALAFSEVAEAFLSGANLPGGRGDAIAPNIMRPPPDPFVTSWEGIKNQLVSNFNIDPQDLESYSAVVEEKEFLLDIYRSMQLSRQFELACNREYMVSRDNPCSLNGYLFFTHIMFPVLVHTFLLGVLNGC